MKNLILFFGFILAVYMAYRIYKYQTLDDGLEHLVQNGAVILDVRAESEYKTGHIPGSKNISLGTIRERYTELDKSKTYITVCSHGLRSVKAEHILKERGFKNVYNGGAWIDLQNSLDLNGLR